MDIEIGERLHAWMWRNRVPQTDLAALLGMSQQSLGRKLRGGSAWSAGELRRAGLLLSVSVGWFFGETEEVPVRPNGLEPPTAWAVVWAFRAYRAIGHAVLGRRRPEGLLAPDLVEGGAVRSDDLALAA